MCCKSLLAVVGLAAIAGSIALAQPAQPNKDAKPGQPATKQPAAPAKPVDASKPAGQPEGMPPIPGMTEQQMKDMQTCMEAGAPGPQHAELAKAAGTWAGKCKMWMSPEAKEPSMTSECTQTVTSIMDGRFIKIDVKGDMAGMPYHGAGVTGFDNVSQKYVCTWFDNCGSGIMNGVGEASQGGKVITFKYTYNCPIQKKPTTMREVHTHTSPDAFTLESFINDPHSGKEYKMMEIAFTRKSHAKAAD
jgi:hypothetical protein